MTQREMTLSPVTDLQIRQDLAALHAAVRNFGAFADAGLFAQLEALFAPRVHVDYQSLTGQAPARVEAATLMREWAGVLPGFDLTFHHIDGINIDLHGDSASVAANVCADHFVAGLFWRVRGCYEFTFQHGERRWKIDSLRFLLREEEGTRDVFGLAISAVQDRAA
ncbi:MAG: hypothetical protein H6R19_2526 [Proteobacteria bacterium]|nr:hypothetical protein [Pseudomonadota bacterium]